MKNNIVLALMILVLAACSKNEEESANKISTSCDKVASTEVLNLESSDNQSVNILEASYIEGCLSVTLQYAGGCEDHEINMSLIPSTTLPASIDVFEAIILHETTDMCEANITETISFDISEIYSGDRDTNINFQGSDVVVEIRG